MHEQRRLLLFCNLVLFSSIEFSSAFRNGFTQETIGGILSNAADLEDRRRIDKALLSQMPFESNFVYASYESRDDGTSLNITCPMPMLIIDNKLQNVNFSCNLSYRLTFGKLFSMDFDTENVVSLSPKYWIYLAPGDESDIPFNVSIVPLRMGTAYLLVWIRQSKLRTGSFSLNNVRYLVPENKSNINEYLDSLENASDYENRSSSLGFPVRLLRARGALEISFRVIMAILIISMTFVIGCELDVMIIWQFLKKPIGPGIGFMCQFGMMPLVAFGLSMLLPIRPEFGFGLLTVGCSPGGGGSNVWSLLLHGDLNLSMTMTFVSCVAALGMMPLMLFIFGRFFLDVNTIRIPYLQIAGQLLYVVIPVIAGFLMKRFQPKIAATIRKALQPLAFIFLAVLIGFGTFVNLPIYSLIGEYILLLPTAALLPWIGFAMSGLVAFICRRPRKEVITIAIETGIQNIGVAILILIYSMPQPEGDISAVVPLVVSLFTPIPLLIALIVISIKKSRSCCKNGNSETHKDDIDEAEELRDTVNEGLLVNEVL